MSPSPTTSPSPTPSSSYDCSYIGGLVVEYSRLNTQQTGSASIETILDTRLLDDWSATVEVPAGETKAPIMRCWARVRWSIGLTSDVDMWLLIDSQKQIRVRWDNIRNVSSPDPQAP